jgi:hypothetical protein
MTGVQVGSRDDEFVEVNEPAAAAADGEGDAETRAE